MKRILLTTTSLVLAAGVAQADITWSGSATAGLARDGKVKAVASTEVATHDVDTLEADYAAIATLAASGANADAVDLVAISGNANVADFITDLDTQIALSALNAQNAATAAIAEDEVVIAGKLAALKTLAGRIGAVVETPTGKMKQYSEVNATASASVATDMGWVVSAAISVDAGTGYDFADDDTFDAAKTNGVGLDSVSIDFGAGGKLTLDQDNFAHLVDADDDAAADLMYTNTFGTASFSFAADIDDGDVDTKARAASLSRGNTTQANAGDIVYTAAVAADVQWSTKVSMPLAGTNVYFAADEEGGDAYGVSGTYAGIGWSVDSKREALAKDTGAKRSNTVKVSYATGALTLGASYDSIKDGDQWGVSAAYAAGALSLNVSTDEGSDWSASGAYDLGNGASLVGGTNYTEDAYVGVSFAF